MDLKEYITTSHKEIAGSRSKNRLSIQISYAMQLIMEFYSLDYIILMDYIEDIAVIEKPDSPERIFLYQIKTKTTGQSFTLKTIIDDEWFLKLYRNACKYLGYLSSADIVCNTEVLDEKKKCVFPNNCTKLDDQAITNNVLKIKTAIASTCEIPIEKVDLSKFRFIKALFTVQRHRQEAEYEFESFLKDKEGDVQVALARSIFSTIFDMLDRKFNAEINEDCTDINEIFENKGVSSDWVRSLIECGVAIQLPDLEKLYNSFDVVAISDIKTYKSAYSRIKMDLLQSSRPLYELIRLVQQYIETKSDDHRGNIKDFHELIYKEFSNSEVVPQPYKGEYYLRLLIMILVFKFCYRGNEQ
jgi:hypothetical protein